MGKHQHQYIEAINGINTGNIFCVILSLYWPSGYGLKKAFHEFTGPGYVP